MVNIEITNTSMQDVKNRLYDEIEVGTDETVAFAKSLLCYIENEIITVDGE